MARKFSRATLALAGSRDESEFCFFYGHGPKSGDKAVFSNWYVLEEPFVDEYGNKFPTSEHYMMFAKAKLFDDERIAARVLSCESADEAKKLGRMVENFDAATWDANCIQLVAKGCEMKFSQSELCKTMLMSTGNLILVEAAPRDTIWGIGYGSKNPMRLDPAQWRGENRLGEVLMIVRERMQNAERAASVPQQGGQDRGSGSSSSRDQCHSHYCGSSSRKRSSGCKRRDRR